jgi:nitrogen regulatory protein P-II 1
MKKVEAIIRVCKLDEVKDALKAIGVEGITVMKAIGFGNEEPQVIAYRGARQIVDLLPKMKLETIVDDDQVEGVVDAIYENAHTGEPGDGRILVVDLMSMTRIRTGEVKGLTGYGY